MKTKMTKTEAKNEGKEKDTNNIDKKNLQLQYQF